MHRTTIMLPEDLKRRASELAERVGISLGELIRDSLAKRLLQSEQGEARDPLFADDEVFHDDGPRDLSRHLDSYLYGEDL